MTTDAFTQPFIPFTEYVLVRDGNHLAASIANRHYSRNWRNCHGNSDRFMPPGRRLILVEPFGQWLFAWSQQKYRDDGQTGVNCSIFRNESSRLSSEIILLAEKAWNELHGNCRKFTYVHPEKIKSSNPGYCFQAAGWKKQALKSTRGLVLLVKEAA